MGRELANLMCILAIYLLVICVVYQYIPKTKSISPIIKRIMEAISLIITFLIIIDIIIIFIVIVF